MDEASAQAAKAALRDRLRARREALDADARRAADAAIDDRLRRLPELAGARTVLGYAGHREEASVDATLRRLLASGVTVCLSWVDGDDLVLAEIDDLDGLVAGWRGVREPSRDRPRVAADALDVVLAPGVGFDAAGNRLGSGGGHFDRLLARVPSDVVVVGVGYDEQVVAHVPAEAHDRRVDVVVTPSATLRRPG